MVEEEKKKKQIGSGLEMYFNHNVAKKFAELEQNEKNFRVADIVDKIIMQEMTGIKGPIYAAELGGGAHPDRYDRFFAKLLQKPNGHLDWVDISPYMLDLAKQYLDDDKYRNRWEVITFIEDDILNYLNGLEDEVLDLAIMKYTFDHIENVSFLFELLSKKLKDGGKMIATITTLSPELKSISTNARFLYQGEEFPENETRKLEDGERFRIKFFKQSGNPEAGYMEEAETEKFFHSKEKIVKLAKQLGFDYYLGDWKGLANKNEHVDQIILVLTKNRK